MSLASLGRFAGRPRGVGAAVCALYAVSVAGLAVAGVLTARAGFVRVDAAIGFALVIVLGELAPVRLAGGRLAAPVGSAGALGYAMLFDVGGRPLRQGLAQVVIVVTAAALLAAGVRAAAGRPARLPDIVRRVVLATVAGAIFRLAAPAELRTYRLAAFKPDMRWIALLLVAIAAFAALADMLSAATVRAFGGDAAFGFVVRDEVRATAGLWLAVCATGALTALATPSMQLYALPVLCVPLVLTQFAFRRYAAVRTTYLQTIRSLSRVTEVGGCVTDGHALRVSQLAVGIGRRLGLSERDLVDLEYAALLHDIGQLSLADPIPGGSTLIVAPVERRRVAELGADVIKTTGVLDAVAGIVARQADPYRRHREPPDESLPLESRIIKAASAYDDLVGAAATPELVADALERLRLGMAYEYDPKVVEALTRVATRELDAC